MGTHVPVTKYDPGNRIWDILQTIELENGDLMRANETVEARTQVGAEQSARKRALGRYPNARSITLHRSDLRTR